MKIGPGTTVYKHLHFSQHVISKMKSPGIGQRKKFLKKKLIGFGTKSKQSNARKKNKSPIKKRKKLSRKLRNRRAKGNKNR
jgi:hypothetical protein